MDPSLSEGLFIVIPWQSEQPGYSREAAGCQMGPLLGCTSTPFDMRGNLTSANMYLYRSTEDEDVHRGPCLSAEGLSWDKVGTMQICVLMVTGNIFYG